MSSPRFSPVLFDFDGTLVDTAPGITAALAATLEHFGLPAQEPAALRRRIGPPLPEIVRRLTGFEGEALLQAIAYYREQRGGGLAGIGASQLFPGVEALLDELAAAGVPLAIATSRPQESAQAALDHFGLSARFSAIVGAAEQLGRSDKTGVVAEALRLLAEHGAAIDPARTILVGDRVHDAEGAAANGIAAVLVDWGYGVEAEAAGTLGYARGPEALRALLFD